MKVSFFGSAVSPRRLFLWLMALAVLAATVFASAADPASGAVPSGRAFGFGYNSDGQLGNGTTNDTKAPDRVINANDDPIANAKVVKAGCYHGLALNKSGTVLAWGENEYGQLGDGTTDDRAHAAPVPGLTDVKAISAGCYHSLAIKENGSVWAWGYNYYGELGNGKDDADYTPGDPQELEPVKVDGLSNVKNVSAGYYYSMAVKQSGTAWTWGYGGYGQIGNGDLDDSKVPERVQSLTNVRTVSAHAYSEHSLALREDGTVWAWGENEYGQLGNGKDEADYTPADAVELEPVKVNKLTNVKGISGGYDYSLAMTNAGTVFSWGDNEYNQLGDGDTDDKNVPERIEGLTNVKSISAGTYHALALRENGALFGWGYNEYGEVGNGKDLDDYTPDEPQEPTPVRVGLKKVKNISAGYYASLVSKQ